MILKVREAGKVRESIQLPQIYAYCWFEISNYNSGPRTIPYPVATHSIWMSHYVSLQLTEQYLHWEMAVRVKWVTSEIVCLCQERVSPALSAASNSLATWKNGHKSKLQTFEVRPYCYRS